MSNDIPYRLANGVGNPPDAEKFMADYDWLTSILFGNHIANGGFEFWNNGTSFTNPADATELADHWVLGKSGSSAPTANITRESTEVHEQTYALAIDITGAGSADSIVSIKQTLTDFAKYKDITVAVGFMIKTATGSKVRVHATDGVSDAYSSYHDGDDTYQMIHTVLTVDSSPTELTFLLEITSDFTDQVYIDGAFVYIIPSSMTTTARAFLRYSEFSPKSPGKDDITFESGLGPIIKSPDGTNFRIVANDLGEIGLQEV